MNSYLDLCGLTVPDFDSLSVTTRADIVNKFLVSPLGNRKRRRQIGSASSSQKKHQAHQEHQVIKFASNMPGLSRPVDDTKCSMSGKEDGSMVYDASSVHELEVKRSMPEVLEPRTEVDDTKRSMSGKEDGSMDVNDEASPSVHESMPEIQEVGEVCIADGEACEILRQSEHYLHLSRLSVVKATRQRVHFPSRKLNLKQSVPSEVRMWLERLASFGENLEINEDSLSSHTTILEMVFSCTAVNNFEAFLSTCSLEATTKVKGYFCLLSFFTRSCGKSLSLLNDNFALLTHVRQMRARLQDLARAWQAKANETACTVEVTRLQNFNVDLSSEQSLTSLFFLLHVELKWYRHTYMQAVPSRFTLLRASGFVYFAMLMARCATRCDLLKNVKLREVYEQVHSSPTSCLQLVFAHHKNVRSEKALFLLFLAFLTPILKNFIEHVRRSLLRFGMWKGDDQYLFPRDIVTHYHAFMASCGLDSFNPSEIRRLLCDAVDSISPTSKFYNIRDELQASALHKARSTKIIERHYASSAKPRREFAFMEYVQESFFNVADELVQTVLRTGVKPLEAFEEFVGEDTTGSEWSANNDDGDSPVELPPIPLVERKVVDCPVVLPATFVELQCISSTLKAQVKHILSGAFRENLYFDDHTLLPLQPTLFELPQVNIDYGTLTATDKQVVCKNLLAYCRSILKSWRCALPAKRFAVSALDADCNFVSDLVNCIPGSLVRSALRQHPAFSKQCLFGEHVVSQIWKVTEARLWLLKAEDDDKKQFTAFLAWKRGGNFDIEPFETFNPEAGLLLALGCPWAKT